MNNNKNNWQTKSINNTKHWNSVLFFSLNFKYKLTRSDADNSQFTIHSILLNIYSQSHLQLPIDTIICTNMHTIHMLYCIRCSCIYVKPEFIFQTQIAFQFLVQCYMFFVVDFNVDVKEKTLWECFLRNNLYASVNRK